jgi:hypothetical protein
MFSKKTAIVCAAAAALSFSGVAATQAANVGDNLNWNGVDWTVYGGTGTADVNGANLELNPTSTSEFGVHVNRLPTVVGGASSINANGTPYISFSFYDTGVAADKIDMVIDDEVTSLEPRISVGSLFSATEVASTTYGANSTDRNNNENYSFFDGARANVLHNVVVGKTADGTVYVGFDGIGRVDTNLKNGVGAFDFNDVYLRIRGDADHTIQFTNFAFGDNFTTSMVPEPSSLALVLGLGGLALLSRRPRRRQEVA